MQNETKYGVGWKRVAIIGLGQLYRIDPERVYNNSVSVLSNDPYGNTEGIADYPDYKYNDFRWANIGNVIIIFKINENKKQVSIEAVCSASTEFALKVFYGEHDPEQ